MARTFTITCGTDSVNLLDPTGFQATSLGVRSLSADANVPGSHLRYVETYKINVYSSDHNDAADQLQKLQKLL